MWNIFKHKTIETPKTEAEIKPVEDLNVAVERNLGVDLNEYFNSLATPGSLEKDSEPMDVRLEVINDYLKECKANGIEVTPEMAAEEIENKLGLNISELLNEEIEDPESKEINKNTASEIENMMSQKATDKGTVLKYLRETIFKSNFAKAAFVTAILFLKFNPGHAANKTAEKEAQSKNKIEMKTPVSHSGDDGDKNYQISAQDFEKPITIKLEADSHFSSNKADINNSAELTGEFDHFLSLIDNHNFEKVINENWTVKGSSDQEKRLGGNEKLTEERINSFTKLLKTTLVNHDFSKQLSSDKIQKILAKDISGSYPVDGAEKGVTYISDLVNSETGQNFTDEEVSKIKTETPKEYEKLLAKCRYTNFEAEVVLEPEMIKLNNFDESSMYFDDSGTMHASKVAIINDLQTISKGKNANKPMDIIFFSDGLDAIEKAKNSSEAIKILRQDRPTGSAHEKVFTSLIQGLERTAKSDVLKIKSGENLPNRVAYLITDEGLQDVNQIFKAADLASKTNTTVILFMAYENGAREIEININDLKDKIEKSIQNTLGMQKTTLEQSKTDQGKIIKDLAFKVVNKVSLKTLKEVLGQDNLGSKEEIVKLLVDNKFELPKFQKSLDSRIEDSILRPLISAKQSFARMDSRIDKADKMTVGKYMAQNNLQINTFTDKEGNKVILPITDISGTSQTLSLQMK